MRLVDYCTISAALLLAACGSQEQGNGGADANSAAGNQVSADQPDSEEAEETGSRLQPVDNSARAGQPGSNPNSENMEWNFNRTGGVPKLAFGEPQTDNVRLMLRCPESGSVLVSFLRPDEFAEGKPDMLSIVSGNSRRSLTIETEQGPLGTSVLAEAPLSAGPLEQFRSGNDLEVHWGDETIRVPGAEQGPVREFFDACG